MMEGAADQKLANGGGGPLGERGFPGLVQGGALGGATARRCVDPLLGEP